MFAQKPNFARFLLSHHAGEIGRTEAGIERTDLRPRLSEDGILGSNGEIAHHVKHMSATDGIAIDHGDDGLRKAPYLHLHIEHIETGHTI